MIVGACDNHCGSGKCIKSQCKNERKCPFVRILHRCNNNYKNVIFKWDLRVRNGFKWLSLLQLTNRVNSNRLGQTRRFRRNETTIPRLLWYAYTSWIVEMSHVWTTVNSTICLTLLPSTLRSECRCTLRLRYVDLVVSIEARLLS
jgi:hypothetical protein